MNASHDARLRKALASLGLRSLCLGALMLALGASDGTAASATLQSLLGGGSLNVGQSQFSDWELLGLDSTMPTNPDFSQIAVVPLVTDPSRPGFQFVANGQLSASGINTIDLSLKFKASALAGSSPFVGHELEMTGVGFSGSGGIAFITGDATNGAGADVGQSLVIFDNGTGFSQLIDATDYSPTSEVHVVLNALVTGPLGIGTTDLATFSQRFTQTAPAGLIGDYNQDGTVNAPDFVLWRNTFGQTGPSLLADGDGDQVVDNDDYDLWKMNFGMTAGSGNGLPSILGTTSSIPEPTTLTMLLFGPLAALLRFRVLA